MEAVSDEIFAALKFQIVVKGVLEIKVVTDSMAPLIKPGEQVTIAPLRQPLNPGDIVVFHQRGKLICHLIKKTSSKLHPGALICGGLKSRGMDLPVLPEKLLGQVVSHKMGFKAHFYFILSEMRILK